MYQAWAACVLSKVHLAGMLYIPKMAQSYFNPFAPGDFAEKRILKLVEWFSGHCRAIKS